MKKIIFYRVISVIMLVAWMITIFAFSSQDATNSSKTSGGIVEKIISVVYSDFDELPADNQSQISNVFSFVVRKTAHFFEYFILGALAIITAIVFEKFKLVKNAVASAVFCILYAISDEIHQHFVPGRACRFFDVCVDAVGILFAIVLIVLIKHIKDKKMSERNAKKGTN